MCGGLSLFGCCWDRANEPEEVANGKQRKERSKGSRSHSYVEQLILERRKNILRSGLEKEN